MFKQNFEKTCCDVRFKLIFTDLNMHNLDGISAAKQIMAYQKLQLRLFPNRRKVPIVAITAYEDDQTLNNCLKAGISRVISKPVNIEKLDAAIQDYYHNYD